jgi:uncharacterized protein YybS (DUF2232 family)
MKMTDLLGCVSASLLLLMTSVWIPFIGPFFSLLTPLPFLYYTSKLGPREGVKIVGITLALVGVISYGTGTFQLAFFCLEFSLLGFFISEIYRRGFTFGLTILWGTGAMLLVGAAFLLLIGLSQNMGPLELLRHHFQGNLEETIRMYEDTGLDQEKITQVRAWAKAVMDMIMRIYPALLIIGTGFMVWVNVVISRPLFRIGGLKYPDFGPMDRWQAPDHMVWALILAGFASFLPSTGIRWLAINTLLVLVVIYFFHGLSILLFFLNKYHIALWIRIGIYVLILFQWVFMVILALAGLFDQWIDFRKIHKKSVSE